MEKLNFKNIKYDLPAGLVVFLVAIPLCLGIALASGAPLFSGVISGIIGGILVGYLSPSHFSVSGPAAGLTVIVLSSIDKLGGMEIFFAAVVVAGIIQVLLGYLKAGLIAGYIPSSVIKGMLAAIGIILILKQIPHMMGYDKDNEGDFFFFQTDGENTFSEIIQSFNHVHPGAIIISIVSLTFLIFWESSFIKNNRFLQLIPGPLLMITIGIGFNEFYKYYYTDYYLSGEELVNLPVATSASEFFGFFHLPSWDSLGKIDFYLVAITIAIIASLESLLSVEATDKLDPYKRKTDSNQELKAQGIGNIFSGMLGGLPITAVIVRSSANIHAGAKSKLAAIFHGIFLLISVLFIGSVLNLIPLSCLAALLILVGYKLTKFALIRSMYRAGWDQFLPFISTIIAIQFTDLLVGIGIGLAVSIFFILKNNYKRAFTVTTDHENFITLQLSENVTFINKGNLQSTLIGLPSNSKVIINASKCHFIDPDVLEIIHEFKSMAELKHINLKFIKIPELPKTYKI